MTFQYQVDEGDFVSAGKLLLRTRGLAKVRRVVVMVSLCLLAAACVLLLVLREFPSAAVAALFLLVYAGLYSMVGWQYRRQFRKIPALHSTRTLTDQHGLQIVSALSDSRFSWQVLDRFSENDRTFLLVQQGGRVFFPISKRQLSPEQIADFRALCAAHIPDKH